MVQTDLKNLGKRLLIRVCLGLALILFFVFLFPRVLSMLSPFILAFILAAILNPLVNKVSKSGKISRRLLAAALSTAIFLFVLSIVGFVLYTIGHEIVSPKTFIQQNLNTIMGSLSIIKVKIAEIVDFLPVQIQEMVQGLEENIFSFLQKAVEDVLEYLFSSAAALTTKAGSILINFLLTVLGAYFIIADYNGLIAAAKKRMNSKTEEMIVLLRDSIVSVLGGYARAQVVLALLAFVFMFIALVIYGQPHAFFIALFLSFIDLLPLLGAIAALAPWGIVEMLGGDMTKGLFLIGLGISFSVIRKIIEPKILGSQTGLHPLAALISTYVGLQLSGLWGALMGPMVLMLIMSITKSGIFDSTVSDFKDFATAIIKMLNTGTKEQQDRN